MMLLKIYLDISFLFSHIEQAELNTTPPQTLENEGEQTELSTTPPQTLENEGKMISFFMCIIVNQIIN
jgi:hypothetical protein